MFFASLFLILVGGVILFFSLQALSSAGIDWLSAVGNPFRISRMD